MSQLIKYVCFFSFYSWIFVSHPIRSIISSLPSILPFFFFFFFSPLLFFLFIVNENVNDKKENKDGASVPWFSLKSCTNFSCRTSFSVFFFFLFLSFSLCLSFSLSPFLTKHWFSSLLNVVFIASTVIWYIV